MRGTRRTVLVACLAAALLVGAAAVAAGCGGDGRRTFYNDQYGFSLALDHTFADWSNATVDANGTFRVAFADRGGAQAGGRYLDAVVVAVVDMGHALTPAEEANIVVTLQGMGGDLIGQLGDDVQTATPQPVTINGSAGVVVPFSVSIAATPVMGWSYLLPRGHSVYVVALMAAATDWERERTALTAAIESFRATGVVASTAPSATPSGVPAGSGTPAPALTPAAPASSPVVTPQTVPVGPTVSPPPGVVPSAVATHKPNPGPRRTTSP